MLQNHIEMDEMVTKVDVLKSNKVLIWTPVFEWYVARCRSKNGHQKDMRIKEIGLRAQNMPTILGSRLNRQHNWGERGHIWPFNEHYNVHFDNEHHIHTRSRNYKANSYMRDLDFASYLALIACFICYEMWEQRESTQITHVYVTIYWRRQFSEQCVNSQLLTPLRLRSKFP